MFKIMFFISGLIDSFNNVFSLKELEDVIKIVNATKEYEIDYMVTSIDVSDKNNYSIYLEEEKKKIYLGDNTNLSNKILYANAIMEKEKGKVIEYAIKL